MSARRKHNRQVFETATPIPTTIRYSVGRNRLSFAHDLSSLDTPRSIHISVLKHYASCGNRVVAPYYDDDNDEYSPSNVKPVVEVSDEMLGLPCFRGMTREKISKSLN